MTQLPSTSGQEAPNEERKQGLLMDIFYYLPETGIFDGADSKKHALIATMLQSLSVEKLEKLIELAISEPEIFKSTLLNHLENAASTQRKINAIVGGILVPNQEGK